MKKLIILGAFLFSINSLNAQTSTNYEEASNPISTNPSLWVKVSAPQVSWGSTDIRYKKEEPAPIARLKKDINLTAWKGERVSAQLVVWTPEALDNLSFIVSDLTSGKETISKDNVRTGFVRYVMTDELNKDGKGGCGYRKSSDYDSTLVADRPYRLHFDSTRQCNTRRLDQCPCTPTGKSRKIYRYRYCKRWG